MLSQSGDFSYALIALFLNVSAMQTRKLAAPAIA